MDEILIEEKKYISSKRAAKMTGYAKDYVSQLCREGRVPARLIGRSWYVLEAAIQDHRFGNPGIEPVGKEKRAAEVVSTWESPRYEASREELLPSVNRFKDTESPISTVPANNKENDPQRIQDSWKAWFDRFDHSTEDATEQTIPEISEELKTEDENLEETRDEKIIREEEDVIVPIHTVSRPLYRPPPEEFLPRKVVTTSSPNEPEIREVRRQRQSNRGVMRVIQMTGAMVAVVLAVVAIIGSGYFDAYIISNSQVRIIAGVALYNK
ncbi:MAG: hypothetical protein NTY93_02385 [Candidatus Kaiserbacteria bacterium]|nr:hypothetical protein [Candidatus Kaiserbacteria bacterium]